MKWCIDMDGVITTAPHIFQWWSYFLIKNNHKIFILSARNPKRLKQTKQELKDWNIKYTKLIMMDKSISRDYKTQGEWKISQVKKIGADMWIDNDFKIYEKVCGIDFSSCKAERLMI